MSGIWWSHSKAILFLFSHSEVDFMCASDHCPAVSSKWALKICLKTNLRKRDTAFSWIKLLICDFIYLFIFIGFFPPLQIQQLHDMEEVCYNKVLEQVKAGHQVTVSFDVEPYKNVPMVYICSEFKFRNIHYLEVSIYVKLWLQLSLILVFEYSSNYCDGSIQYSSLCYDWEISWKS